MDFDIIIYNSPDSILQGIAERVGLNNRLSKEMIEEVNTLIMEARIK